MNTYWLVMIAAFFWGANFVLAGFVMADISPWWAAALRFMLAASLMLALSLWRREDLIESFKRHALTYFLMGCIGIAGFNVFFFHALAETSADSAALIMATNPLLTTLLAALFLNERPSARHIAAIPLALFGVAIVISEGHPARLIQLQISRGDLLMLIADLAWAAYNVLGRRNLKGGSTLSHTTWMMGIGAAILLVAALTSSTPIKPLGVAASISLAVMTVAGTVLAYLFWNKGIIKLGAARTSIFINLVPVGALMTGMLLGILPSVSQLTGGALVLTGVTLSMLPSGARVNP